MILSESITVTNVLDDPKYRYKMLEGHIMITWIFNEISLEGVTGARHA